MAFFEGYSKLSVNLSIVFSGKNAKTTMLKQQLQQKLQQRISPQQIQLIKLMELPALELEERIKHELEENPALEEDSASSGEEPLEKQDDALTEDLLLGDYLREDDIPDYKLREIRSIEENRREDISRSLSKSLYESLLEQLSLRELTPKERAIGQQIIGNIDDDGYLRRPLDAITDDIAFSLGIEASEEEAKKVLAVVQDLDPPGIASKDLRESLLIQLSKKEQKKRVVLACTIIGNYFDEFSKHHYDKIMRSLHIGEEEMKSVLQEILSLNPKPGNLLEDDYSEKAAHIIPDFFIETREGKLVLSLNNSNIPELKISREYSEMVDDFMGNKKNRTSERRDAILFVKQKIDAAQWFIDAVKQRQETLLKTMTSIMDIQYDFFLTGDESSIKPMILKDIADKTGYNISTISRVRNSKYVQCEHGIYPLKSLFSESMSTDSGQEVSAIEIKALLKTFVDNEDKKKPLTDEALAEKMKEEGYVIARRTIVKYREQSGIPIARLRKEL